MMKDTQLDIETYLADVSIRCFNPPDWVPHMFVRVLWYVAAQAGSTLQPLVSGNPTAGQLVPTVSVEARVFGHRAYA